MLRVGLRQSEQIVMRAQEHSIVMRAQEHAAFSPGGSPRRLEVNTAKAGATHIAMRRRVVALIPESQLEIGLAEHVIHSAFLAARRVIVIVKSVLHDGQPEDVSYYRELASRYPAGAVDVLEKSLNSSKWRDSWFGSGGFASPSRQFMGLSRYVATLELLGVRPVSTADDRKESGSRSGSEKKTLESAYQQAHARLGRELSPDESSRWHLQLDGDEVVNPWHLPGLIADLEAGGEKGASLLAAIRERRTPNAPNEHRDSTGSSDSMGWMSTTGCSLSLGCPRESTVHMSEWIVRSAPVNDSAQINTDYGLLLSEDVLARLPPYTHLHHLER